MHAASHAAGLCDAALPIRILDARIATLSGKVKRCCKICINKSAAATRGLYSDFDGSRQTEDLAYKLRKLRHGPMSCAIRATLTLMMRSGTFYDDHGGPALPAPAFPLVDGRLHAEQHEVQRHA